MNKTYTLKYDVTTENLKQLILLAFELSEITGMEPAQLVLPDGRIIPWNKLAAQKIAAKGDISEEELIKFCK
jgi:hypothetical protein